MSVRGQAGCVHKPPAVLAESKRPNQFSDLAVVNDDDVVYGISN